MADEIKLTIDGKEVKSRPGISLLQAAIEAGKYIPYLCHYPGIKAIGACRMCIVEIEGVRGTPTSCTTTVADGMVVRTNTPALFELRKNTLDLLLTQHPHACLTCERIKLCGPSNICLRHVSVNDRCVTCPKNERCELKDVTRYMEMDLETSLMYSYRGLPQRVNDPLWEMDQNLCIACGRCVRICSDVRGDKALALTGRSTYILVNTAYGSSLLESGCEFCGACIDACPTGALVERRHKWVKAKRNVQTTCPICPVGCQLKLSIDSDGHVIRSAGAGRTQANQGQVCFRGKFGLDYVNRTDRTKKPLIRKNGSLIEASWDEAINFTAEKLAQYKGEEYALMVSPQSPNEDCYVAQKFARIVMGSNNVDLVSNMKPELVNPLGEMLGYRAGTTPIWDLEKAKCIVVVSSNITEEQTVAAVPVKKAVQAGAKLVVIDQRETELTRFAHSWLRPVPGTELALIGGLLRVIFDESLDDHNYVAERIDNLQSLTNSLGAFDLVRVSGLTNIPVTAIQTAARMVAKSSPCAIVYGLDTVAQDSREACVRALVDLALVTGSIGKPAAGLYPMYTGANEQGAKDVGCQPDVLPGSYAIGDSKAREKVEKAWAHPLPSARGLGIRDLIPAINQGKIKALHIVGNGLSLKHDGSGSIQEALQSIKFLVLQSNFKSALYDLADVILPSASFESRDGTYTNLERRVQLFRKMLSPKGREEPDWYIFTRIATQMGAAGFQYADVESVFNEIAGLVEAYGGINYERLAQKGIQWPCLTRDAAGTPGLYSLNGASKSRFKVAALVLAAAKRHFDPEYPLLLAKGRLLHDARRQVSVINQDGRNVIKRDKILEFHADDAKLIGIKAGDRVVLTSTSESIEGVASISSPHRGLVLTTTLFGSLITDLETNEGSECFINLEGLSMVPVYAAKLNGSTSGKSKGS